MGMGEDSLCWEKQAEDLDCIFSSLPILGRLKGRKKFSIERWADLHNDSAAYTLWQSWLWILKKANGSELMGSNFDMNLNFRSSDFFFPEIQVGVDVGEFKFYYFLNVSSF